VQDKHLAIFESPCDENGEFIQNIIKLRSSLLEVYLKQKQQLVIAADSTHASFLAMEVENNKKKSQATECNAEIQMLLSKYDFFAAMSAATEDEDASAGIRPLGLEFQKKEWIDAVIKHQLALVMAEVTQYYKSFIPFELWKGSNTTPLLIQKIKEMMLSDNVLLDAHMSIYRSVSTHFQLASSSSS